MIEPKSLTDRVSTDSTVSGHSWSLRRIFTLLCLALAFGLVWAPKPALADAKDAPAAAEKKEQQVVFNVKSLKYHSMTCKWAVKCTRNCIVISRSEAIKRGGVPCKICGGR